MTIVINFLDFEAKKGPLFPSIFKNCSELWGPAAPKPPAQRFHAIWKHWRHLRAYKMMSDEWCKQRIFDQGSELYVLALYSCLYDAIIINWISYRIPSFQGCFSSCRCSCCLAPSLAKPVCAAGLLLLYCSWSHEHCLHALLPAFWVPPRANQFRRIYVVMLHHMCICE